MTMTKCLLALVLFAASASTHSAEFPLSFVDDCYDRLPDNYVTVTFEHGDVVYDFGKSIQELKQLKASPHPGRFTVGLASSEIKTTINRNFSTHINLEHNYSCSRGELIVHIYTPTQTVYVAREFPPESCEFTEILKHEQEHIEITKRHIEEVASYLTNYIPELQGNDPFFDKSANALSKRLSKYYSNELFPFITDILGDVSKKHDFLDRPEVYEANSYLCDGGIQKVLNAYEANN